MLAHNVKFLQKAVIFHPHNRTFLTLRRGPDDHARPNLWDLPGGNVEFGENHLDAIEREIREETGLDVTGLEPVHVETRPYRDRERDAYLIFVGHRCRARTDTVTISPEHTAYRWATKEEFLDLVEFDLLTHLVQASFDRSRSVTD